MKKNQLRKLYLNKRLELFLEEYDSLNNGLLDQFKTVDLSNVEYLHIFLPMREKREPDTFLLIDWLKQHNPEIKLVYPKANFAHNTMTHFLDDGDLVLAENAFKIQEPVSGNEVTADKIDMVIIPLLAFDKQGYRIGYGKGFYDRFMAECKPGTQFIGVSFFEPVDEIEDVNKFDMQMQQCITPGKIWRFQ